MQNAASCFRKQRTIEEAMEVSKKTAKKTAKNEKIKISYIAHIYYI